MPALAPHAAACEAGSGGGQAGLMNPLFLPPLTPAEPQTAPSRSVRASRAASARPASGGMRGTLRRRAGRAYEPPLPATAAASRAEAGAWRQREGFTGCQRSPARGRMRGRLRRRASRAYEPPLTATAAAGRAEAGAWRQHEGFTGCQRSPGKRPHARQAASARRASGRMRGRRASRAYEPPPSFAAAAGRAAAGAWRQREGFTGCQRSPRKRPHARQAAEEGRQGL